MITRLQEATDILLQCLCEAVTGAPNPPLNCCLRIGDQPAHDADMFTDLCCEGLAYVSVGDIFPVVDSFPEQSIVTQANQVCVFPSWAINFRAGIIRCVPVGTDTTMPTCAEWNEAAYQSLYDAETLAQAACCFTAQWRALEPGMSVVLGANSVNPPEGGCVERFITLQIQTPNCSDC